MKLYVSTLFFVVPVMGVEPSLVDSLCANLTVQRAVIAQLLRILQQLAAQKIKSVYLLCVLWVSSTDDSGENFIQLGGSVGFLAIHMVAIDAECVHAAAVAYQGLELAFR